MNPTPQQQAVFDAVEQDSEHINVQALAGSGKSTTAVECANRAFRHKVGFVAFNKHIADELKTKLGGSAKACTLHSLGFRAVKKAFPSAELDENKPKKLLQKLNGECVRDVNGRLLATDVGRAVLAITQACKMSLVDPNDLERLSELVDRRNIDLPNHRNYSTLRELQPLVGDLLDAEAKQLATIDFDDQIWLPTKLGLAVERFDVLMVDEAQDLSPCQQAIAKSACGDRMIVVGDTNQSIYAFNGADPDSIPNLITDLSSRGGCLDRPLTVTFRCPVSHVALARQIVPALTPRDNAPDGEVAEIDNGEIYPLLQPGDMVLSRRNAHLVTLTLELLGKGIPAVMIGRDIGAGIQAIVDELKPGSIHELLQDLSDWHSTRIEKLEKKDASESQFQSLSDRVACVKELACSCHTVRALRDKIKSLGSEKPDPSRHVFLSSVHRAKGLESDRVFIIDTESMPMILSCRECRSRGCGKCKGRGTRSTEIDIRQERNLLYVALTRAKQSLTFVGGMPAVLGGAW